MSESATFLLRHHSAGPSTTTRLFAASSVDDRRVVLDESGLRVDDIDLRHGRVGRVDEIHIQRLRGRQVRYNRLVDTTVGHSSDLRWGPTHQGQGGVVRSKDHVSQPTRRRYVEDANQISAGRGQGKLHATEAGIGLVDTSTQRIRVERGRATQNVRERCCERRVGVHGARTAPD